MGSSPYARSGGFSPTPRFRIITGDWLSTMAFLGFATVADGTSTARLRMRLTLVR
jgi:hypothetical protein